MDQQSIISFDENNMNEELFEQKEKMAKMKKEKIVTDELNNSSNIGHSMSLAGGGMGLDGEEMVDALTGMSAEEAKGMKMKKNKTVKGKDPARSRAQKAGLVFPVARVHQKLKHLVPAHCRVSTTAAVFLSAVIEYLVAELCVIAGNRAHRMNRGPESTNKQTSDNNDNNMSRKRKSRIVPRLIHLAIQDDPEFADLLQNVTLSGGGVVPMSDKRLKEQMQANKRVKTDIVDDMIENEGAGGEGMENVEM